MEKAIANGDKEALVKVVKFSQTWNMKGSEGDWKEYLAAHDRKFGTSISDPSKRPLDMLAAFLKTFTEEDRKASNLCEKLPQTQDISIVIVHFPDNLYFGKIIKMNENRKEMEELIKKADPHQCPRQTLVQLTHEHPLYSKHYSFPSHNEGWVLTKFPKASKLMRSDAMLAIDCEMVLCEDGTEAVVKVCAVDDDMQVKLDALVNPMKPVSDYRTQITGITALDLKGVTCCIQDVQKTLKRLLRRGTILVGHSLFHDLEALKVDHKRVIDTAFIFNCLDKPITYTPRLNNLCKAVLGDHLREEGASHVCLDDARAAMKLVKVKLEKGFVDPIFVPQKNVPEPDTRNLLLHNVPSSVSCHEILKIFPDEYAVEIQTNLRTKGSKCSSVATFKSLSEADEAFESLDGVLDKDSYGRPQKCIQMQLSSGMPITFFVRKMKCEEPAVCDQSKKRSIQNEAGDSKRFKSDLNKCISEGNALDSTKCKHIEEIERLNKELSQRDEQIKCLLKLLASLTR